MRVLPLPFPCRGWGPRGVLGYQHHLPMSPAPFRVAQDSAITPFHTPEMRSCFSPAYFFLFKKKNNKSKTAFCSGLELPCRHRGCGCRGAALLQVAVAPRNPLTLHQPSLRRISAATLQSPFRPLCINLFSDRGRMGICCLYVLRCLLVIHSHRFRTVLVPRLAAAPHALRLAVQPEALQHKRMAGRLLMIQP